ncbi:hypothetical protein B0H34DRAFT_654994 [Crassisporium funariophilum]|nr:hypothetical protein B0H34DRAFT_654994 [Crassisporium funariophilum]
MTELSYAISDIQTRIFEIQELRHKSQSSGDTAATTGIIDQSLMTLDERLESVEKGIKNINETLEPFLQTAATPTVFENGTVSENAGILRKHSTLLSEWEAVQDESEVLREELKEDKWLTVFRTVTDQADGMMSSLEKAVNRCQEFIWQVHRKGSTDDFQSNAAMPSSRSEKLPINFEVYTSLLDSYEAKKKHYMPATSKVLSIIDKGVRDRVTKNGETLRRHAESAQRWKNLRERIARTDTEMENARKVLLGGDTSDHESSTSGTQSTKNGYLATPSNGSRSSRGTGSIALSRSISPFRKFARKITGQSRPSQTTTVSPLAVVKKPPYTDPPPSTASRSRQRASIFGLVRGNEPPTPSTPERPSHKYSQSYTPDPSPRGIKVEKIDMNATITSKRTPSRQRWNSSTKVEAEERANAAKGTLSRRPPSAGGYYTSNEDIPPVPPIGTPYRRSLSRASMASSRPWSPITSSNSTTYSSSHFHPPLPVPTLRTPSGAQTPSRAITPGLSAAALRTRAKTPSHIPAPAKNMRSISGSRSVAGWNDDDPSAFPRSHSPAYSTSAISSMSPYNVHPPRPPSRSMIPVPSVHLHTPSRPSSSMSDFNRSESPTMRTFRNTALRAQTPESALRARAQQVPVFQGSVAIRPRISTVKLPPSSFKDGSGSRVPSRPNSRTGAYTPTMDNLPLHEYIPGNYADPLDIEVANVVNSIAHGLLVERVDPPLRKNQIPKEGEEIKAQYAFSNTLSRKVITCRLTTLTRSGKTGGDATTKKVMCRVGGGWQDLSHYILNRQAGLG